MFEGIVEKLLQSYIGKYLEGLDKENLKLGVSILTLDMEWKHITSKYLSSKGLF